MRTFKGGKRRDMSIMQRALARIYDRLRKRAQRQRTPTYQKIGRPLFGPDYEADGYLDGVRDALDAVADRLEAEGVVELAELRGSGV